MFRFVFNLQQYDFSTRSVARIQFDIGMLFVVIDTSTYSPNTCYRIKYKNKIKNFKLSKIPRHLLYWTFTDVLEVRHSFPQRLPHLLTNAA
jgi:hypothetical protein